MDHVVDGPEGTVTAVESEPDLARLTVSTELDPGQRLRIVKLLAYGWSSQRSLPSLRDQVDAALAAAKRSGWDELCSQQREYLDGVSDRADVELEGDPALQQGPRSTCSWERRGSGARSATTTPPARSGSIRSPDPTSAPRWSTTTLTRLTFRLVYRGRRVRVDVRSDEARYELRFGEPLDLRHHGERLTVARDESQSRRIGPAPLRTAPERPPGRTPPRRHREA